MAPPPPALEADSLPGLTLDALRARGAQRIDPLRFAFAEALARRSAAHQGLARQLLDARLARALADCAAHCAQVQAGADAMVAADEVSDPPGPLAELLRQLDPGAAEPAGAQAALGVARAAVAPAELKSLQQYRSTWSRLSLARQMSRSLAQLPQNPGPLNSHLLALRALQLMQDIAPAYLQAFVAQVETLLWLDEASIGPAPAPAKAPRRDAAGKARKTGPARAGR